MQTPSQDLLPYAHQQAPVPYQSTRFAGPASPPPAPRELTLDDAWATLMRRKFLVLAITVAVFSLAVVHLLTAKRLYKSSAVIQVQKDTADALSLNQMMGTQQAEGDATEGNITLQTEAQILQSESLALQVVKELDLEHSPDFQGGGFHPVSFVLGVALKPFSPAGTPDPVSVPLEEAPGRRTQAVAAFASHIKVKPQSGTRLITIEYLSQNPRTAASVVNQLVDDLRNYNFETRQDATKKASEWLQQQLSDLRRRAEDAQAKVVSLQQGSGIYMTGQTDTQGRQQTYTPTLDRLQQTTAQLSQAESARIMKGALYQVVKDGDPELISSLAGNSTLTGAASGIGTSLALLQQLRAEEAQTQAQLNQLSDKFGPAYPKLAEVQASLDGTRKAIKDETARIAARVKNDYTVAQQVESDDRAIFDRERSDAETLNNRAVEYQIARQEADQASSLYQNLLQRMKEADLVADMRSSNITVVDHGMVASRPAKPAVPVTLAAGLFGGLFLGVCGAFLREATDKRIQDLEKLGTESGPLPLAFIPLYAPTRSKRLTAGSRSALSLESTPSPTLPTVSLQSPSMIASLEPRAAYTESLRALRTTLMQSGYTHGQPPQAMVVTSSMPGEGKSMLAINLAIVYAQRGKRVLLVDGDLRTPVLHTRLGIPNERGLADLLLGDKHPATPTAVPLGDGYSLDVLTAGRDTAYPAELLASEEMGRLVDTWRKEYDYIFMDAGPLLLVTDAAILGRSADFTLVIARHNRTEHRSLDRTCQLLRLQGVTRFGVVVNAVRVSGSDQYRYYGASAESKRTREEMHA